MARPPKAVPYCHTTREERLERALEAAADDLEQAAKWAKEDGVPRTASLLLEAARKYRKLADKGTEREGEA